MCGICRFRSAYLTVRNVSMNFNSARCLRISEHEPQIKKHTQTHQHSARNNRHHRHTLIGNDENDICLRYTRANERHHQHQEVGSKQANRREKETGAQWIVRAMQLKSNLRTPPTPCRRRSKCGAVHILNTQHEIYTCPRQQRHRCGGSSSGIRHEELCTVEREIQFGSVSFCWKGRDHPRDPHRRTMFLPFALCSLCVCAGRRPAKSAKFLHCRNL